MGADENCSWADYGTPKDVDLINCLIAQGGHKCSAVVSAAQWAQIEGWIQEGTPFSLEQQAEKRTRGVTLIIAPRQGAILIEAVAIGRNKAGEQVMPPNQAGGQPIPARSFPRPVIKAIGWAPSPADRVLTFLEDTRALLLGMDWRALLSGFLGGSRNE